MGRDREGARGGGGSCQSGVGRVRTAERASREGRHYLLEREATTEQQAEGARESERASTRQGTWEGATKPTTASRPPFSTTEGGHPTSQVRGCSWVMIVERRRQGRREKRRSGPEAQAHARRARRLAGRMRVAAGRGESVEQQPSLALVVIVHRLSNCLWMPSVYY